MAEAKRAIYLDNMSNTCPDPRVVEYMAGIMKTAFGNPSNVHDFGQKTQEIIELARKSAADLIGVSPQEIIFTSCGSESNNFAIRGITSAYKKMGTQIITSSIEHFSVLYALQELEKEGYKVTYLPVDKFGLIDPEDVKKAITNETILISLTHASNEIGTIEPISEIGKIAMEKGIIFHVDAVQTAGTIPLDVSGLSVDALTLSPNQFYGPTGVAALYLKKGTRIIPFIRGGTQEEGKRAGTQNIPGIAGMGKACELAKLEINDRMRQVIPLRDKLLNELPKKIDQFFVSGHPTQRLPGHASGYARFVEGESLSMLLNMQGVAVSTGSACVSKALKASHVLLASGVNSEDVHGSLVFSFGKDNTLADADYVLEKLPPIVARLRQMSPLGGN